MEASDIVEKIPWIPLIRARQEDAYAEVQAQPAKSWWETPESQKHLFVPRPRVRWLPQMASSIHKDSSDAGIRGTAQDDFLTGERIHQWTLVSYSHHKGGHCYYLCQCDCGTVKKVRVESILSGASKSCGCLKKSILSERSLGNTYRSRIR